MKINDGDKNTFNVRNATDFRPKREARNSLFYEDLTMFNELQRDIKRERERE